MKFVGANGGSPDNDMPEYNAIFPGILATLDDRYYRHKPVTERSRSARIVGKKIRENPRYPCSINRAEVNPAPTIQIRN